MTESQLKAAAEESQSNSGWPEVGVNNSRSSFRTLAVLEVPKLERMSLSVSLILAVVL